MHRPVDPGSRGVFHGPVHPPALGSGFRHALFLLALATACGGGTEEPRPPLLELVDFRPRERQGVFLNEPLVLHFSGDLARTSITPQSVRIATASGEPARGARFVSGRELSFVPDPVLSPDLSDGGYTPNTTYVIELAGFPRADALRAENGACLAGTLRIEFHTVSTSLPRAGFVFDDASPDHAKPLHVLMPAGAKTPPNRTRMFSETGLQLEGEEPVDPSTLETTAFTLVKDVPGAARLEFPLRPVLHSNFNKHAFPYQGTTILRLVPRTRIPEGDGYRLSIDPTKPPLCDFAGHPIPVIGRDSLSQLSITVLPGRQEDRAGEYLEEFLDAEMRSSLVVPGADGAASWGTSGRLEVRFPRAAGDGSDGDVVLGTSESRRRLSAARLSLPAGVRCELAATDGPWVLASQGSIDLEGDLHRAGAHDEGPFPDVRPGASVSEWIAALASSRRPVTVLVAGGDIRIQGELSVPGPLLLVAGGRVRMPAGRIRVGSAEAAGAVTLGALADGGTIALWSAAEGARRVTRAAPASLLIDAPLVNPLVRELCYAVRSKPVPSDGRALRWLPSGGVRGRAGAGRVQVRYAGERPGAEDRPPVEADDPSLLVDCNSLSVVMTLVVPASTGAPWDPPSIDSVRVRWESR